MSSEKLVFLGEIAKIQAGQSAPSKESFGDNGIPFIRAGSLEKLINGFPENQLELIPENKIKKLKMKIYRAGTIVFAKSGMSATIGRVYKLKSDCCVVSHLATVMPSRQLNSDYIKYWFLRNPPYRLINDPSYPSIRAADIEKLKLPLPPLETQKKIVGILEKADQLRRDCQQMEQQLNSLVQSVFIDMFGDPVTNPKGWKIGSIGDLLESANYGTSSKASEEKLSYPVLRMNNITYGGDWDFSSLKYMELSDKDKEKYLVKNGEILFNRTNSKELVGKTAVFRESQPMAYAGYLVRARSNKDANPEYIAAYMNSSHGKQTLQGMCKSIVGMANINAKEFQNIKIAHPPLELQNKFGKFVKYKINQIICLKNQKKEYEDLFNALMQKAFKGELNFRSKEAV